MAVSSRPRWLAPAALAAASSAAAIVLALRLRRRRREARRAVCTERRSRGECDAIHRAKVRRIVDQLRALDGSDEPVSLRKRAVSHEVPKNGDLRRLDRKIDVGDLDAIIDIDVERRTCTAEPGVTFVALVEATLRRGLVPIVVPELKTITIGGAVSGCSIESMSFVHGGFHDTCLEYEVIATTGEVLTCRPSGENALVFRMMHGSFGTLGILSKLTFRLVPARRFVHLVHERHPTLAGYLAAIERHARLRDVDFMDGIIHSPSLHVLCCGRFVDEAPYASRYDWMKIYWRSTGERSDDYLRTQDYFFRYDRGVTNVMPRSFLGRLLFGRLLGSNEYLRMAEWLHRFLPSENPTVTLDTFVPVSRAKEFLAWYEKEFAYYPLWCVPYRLPHKYEWLADGFAVQDEMFLDLAIYGMKQDGRRNMHRVMEEELARVGGIKTLISHNYYSEEEFWRIWNRGNYDAVKAVTDPRNRLRGLYEKMCRASQGKQ